MNSKQIQSNSLVSNLLEKAQEAFVLAIEIYNKPTIKYRVEGFAFFICNAWELMLKAHLINIKGDNSIYYKDNPERTISLEQCIKHIFTNDKDPLRLNLEKIIELRNTSTHFITEEYEMVYVPLFQACIFNFYEKMNLFHKIDVTENVSINFLNLVVKEKALNENEIKAKYTDKIAMKLINSNLKLQNLTNNNPRFSISINHYYYITKNKDKATDIIAIDKNSDTKALIFKELKNPNDTHQYTAQNLCLEVQLRLKKLGINLLFNKEIKQFNKVHFDWFCKYYDIKRNERWCFVMKQFKQPKYTYSIQAIEFIVEEIRKDPDNILDNICKKIKK